MKKNPHRGSSFSDFLRKDIKDPDFCRQFEKTTAKLMVGQEVRRIAKEKSLTIRQLAKLMQTSISQVQRLMNNANVSIDALVRFAAATGKRLLIELK